VHLPLEVQAGAILTTAANQQWTAETLLNAYVKRILKMTGNNKAQAAKLLGWSLNKLKRHL
jgi:DNA-binding NtrC family response regulator